MDTSAIGSGKLPVIKRVLFLGGNRFKEDGPLLHFVSVCTRLNIECAVISDDQRSFYPTESMGLLNECLLEKDVDLFTTDKLSLDMLKQYKEDNTLVFCVNCKWILSKEMIEMFPGRVFNYHNSALPEQRGAACHSWRLMQSIDFTRLTIHAVSPEIDKGEIVLQEEIKFDKSISSLTQSYKFFAPKEAELFSKFLNGDINSYKKSDVPSFYWPKLSTNINGYIDWSWTAREIISFCHAFDHPFEGAATFLNGAKVNFSDVVVADELSSFHPFQVGLIYRIDTNGIYVATRVGGVCVKNVNSEIDIRFREGLRFITPPDVLLSALTTKV